MDRCNMIDSSRLWHFLEYASRHGAPWCEWQEELSDLGILEKFSNIYLSRIERRAFIVKCRTECNLGCSRKVVEHPYGHILAACSGATKELPYRLTRKGIQVYGLNFSRFFESICNGLGFRCDGVTFDKFTGIYFLGSHTFFNGDSFPVYFIFQSSEFIKEVRNINLICDVPYILLVSTSGRLTVRVDELLKRKGSKCIVLSEEVFFQGDGSLKVLRTFDDIFSSFQLGTI